MALGVSRRFDAVVFDLFGTLVSEFPMSEWTSHLDRLASTLGVEADALGRAWEASVIERQTGRLGDIRSNLIAMAERAGGGRPSDERLDAAIAVRAALYARHFRPLPGALETVGWVREHAYRSALVSMCAPDAPALWRASAFSGLIDVEVFSSEVGLCKPDPAIYRLAVHRLGVAAERCLYVGDGSYGELRGAAEVGMTAVLIRDPHEVEGSMLRPGFEPWSGLEIASIAQVPSVLARAAAG